MIRNIDKNMVSDSTGFAKILKCVRKKHMVGIRTDIRLNMIYKKKINKRNQLKW